MKHLIKLPEKVEKFIEEKELKRKLKKAGIIIVVCAGSVMIYNAGQVKGAMKCDAILANFLNNHPDMKEPFIKAWEEFYKVKVKA